MHIDNNYLNVSIKYNYLFEQDFRISNITSNNYEIDYKNIELDFDNIYTPFNNNVSIKYNYYPIYHRDYYLLKIIY